MRHVPSRCTCGNHGSRGKRQLFFAPAQEELGRDVLVAALLRVERDGDRLQEEYAFYIGLGLPVYVGQFNLPGTDEALLAVGRKLEGKGCDSPVGTSAAEWQIAGRKIWNWGEKNLHVRDAKVVADELLADLGPLIAAVACAVIPAAASWGSTFARG